jgi:hypothetical protein
MASPRRAVSVRGLRLPDLSDCRNDLSGHADPVAGLVPRHVVGNNPEERRQRVGIATRAGAEEL